MLSIETGQMSAVETRQMSAGTRQMSAVETRHMQNGMTGQRPDLPMDGCLASAEDISLVPAAVAGCSWQNPSRPSQRSLRIWHGHAILFAKRLAFIYQAHHLHCPSNSPLLAKALRISLPWLPAF